MPPAHNAAWVLGSGICAEGAQTAVPFTNSDSGHTKLFCKFNNNLHTFTRLMLQNGFACRICTWDVVYKSHWSSTYISQSKALSFRSVISPCSINCKKIQNVEHKLAKYIN